MPNDRPELFASVAERRTLESQAVAFVAEATAMLHRARAAVEADEISSAAILSRGRADVFQLLGEYQRFKHGSIFNPVILRGTTSAAIVARTLKTECVLMGECFGNYHARWAWADLQETWLAYRRDMLETTGRLLDHLAREQAAITKLLMLSEFYQAPEQPAPEAVRPAA